MGEQRRGEGESVATYWARLLHECEFGPVEVANKHGEVVAVMVSKADWEIIEAYNDESLMRSFDIDPEKFWPDGD